MKKILALLFALFMTVGVLAACTGGGNGGDDDIAGDVGRKGDPTMSTIELYPDREVKEADLKDFAKLIEERAAVLGKAYQVKSDKEKITLTISKELLGKTSAERQSTVQMLTSRGNIVFGYGKDYSSYSAYYNLYGSPEKADIAKASVKKYNKEDILKDYKKNMVEEKKKEIEAFDSDTLYGLEIEFSKDGKKKYKEAVSDETNIVAMHNYDEEFMSESALVLGSVFAENKNDYSKVFIITSGASYKKNVKLLNKIIEQKDADFRLTVEIADEPIWETDEKKFGDGQVSKMNGDTVVVEVNPDDFTRQYNSEKEFAEYEKAVKGRLDALGIKYMFGKTGFDDKTYCVKFDPSDIAPDFIRLIFCEREIEVRSAFDSISYFYTMAAPEVVETDDGYALRIGAYGTLDKIMSENRIDNNKVYLVVNDVTVASADITTFEEGVHTYLDFKDFNCFGDKKVAGEDEKNVLDLICKVGEEQWIPFEATYKFRKYGAKESKEVSLGKLDWKYDSLTAEDNRVIPLLRANGYTVDKMVDKRNMLIITLDMPVDNDLPTAFTEEVKKIYELCGFDGGAYNEILFAMKDDKKESPADEYRIRAYKYEYYGKMLIEDSINGPKFFDYWSATYDIMQSDEFFVTRDLLNQTM